MKNHGIKPGRRPKDWLEGAISYKLINPSGDWTPFVVDGEHQSWGSFDCLGCVSFAANNVFEIQAKQQGLNLNNSDRYLAKESGTTPEGNYVGTVLDTFKLKAYVPEPRWPVPPLPVTWDTYYAPISLPVAAEGLKNLPTFDLEYEYVGNTAEAIRTHLKHAPLMVTIPGHEICALKISDDGTQVTVLDDYTFNQVPGLPFIRTINTSDITDVFKAVVTFKGVPMVEFIHVFGTDTYGLEYTTEFVTTIVKFSSENDAKEKLKNIPGALNADGSVQFSSAKEIRL